MKKLFTFLLFLASTFSLRAAVHTVQVADFSFTPASVNAVCGDTVLWIWVSGTHTTTSSAIPSCANGWDAPINSSVGAFAYVVPCLGTYTYSCTFHPMMTGTINVTCVTGIKEANHPSMNVFPNPFVNRITVQTGGNDYLELSDILGKVMKSVELSPSQNAVSFDLVVPRGVYLLRFYSDGILTDTRKLVRY